MKAIVCHAPEDLRLDTLAADEIGPHQLAVRVAYGGICGSDLHYFRHGGLDVVAPHGVMVRIGLGGDKSQAMKVQIKLGTYNTIL